MKNNFMYNKVKIKVTGKDINRFLMRLNKRNINIYNIKKVSKSELLLVVDYYNYDDILKIKSIYEVEIIEYLGAIKLKNKLKKNYILILFILLGLAMVFILSKMTFEIKIVTNDKDIKNLLLTELKENGIYKYSFLKSYDEINELKENILKKYNNIFEWLEIEKVGTKYIVRYEPRLINENNNDTNIYNIVSKKNARIINLDIESGQIIKNINDYVNKGDLIVSSDIFLYEEIKNITSAKGNVYGEVWYKVNVKYPKNYYEKIKTGNVLNTYSISFFNHKIVFKKDGFSDKINSSESILKNNILPISFNKEKIEEVNIKKGGKKEDAINIGLEKIKMDLEENEYIINYKILKENENDDYIELEMFVSVCENIGEYVAK